MKGVLTVDCVNSGGRKDQSEEWFLGDMVTEVFFTVAFMLI